MPVSERKASEEGATEDGPLDLAPLLAAPVRQEPYPWVAAAGCVRPEALPALRRDFPRLERPGYHPVDTFSPRGGFAALLAQIEAGALDRAMGARFGLDFTALPRLVTVRFTSAAHEGRPHTDSASKVATLLLYLHPGWASPEGRIRVLRREALEDPVAEVSPAEATSSPSTAPTTPGTATPPSSASGGWCRWPGCATPRSWSASTGAARWPGGSRACGTGDARPG